MMFISIFHSEPAVAEAEWKISLTSACCLLLVRALPMPLSVIVSTTSERSSLWPTVSEVRV